MKLCRLRRNSHCAAKLSTSAFDLRIGQHPPDLALEHRRILELALRRDAQQLVVGNAAPQEERQPRRELEIADRIDRAGRDAAADRARRGTGTSGWSSMNAQRVLDAGVEGAVLAAGLVEAEQRRRRRRRYRPPIGAPRQRRQDRLRARGFARATSPCSAGWQTKIRRRLGVSPAPVALNGPVIWTCSMSGTPFMFCRSRSRVNGCSGSSDSRRVLAR